MVCLAPSLISPPYYLSSTDVSILVGWNPPDFDGGCPIYTYELYRNDGDGTPPTTIVDDANIKGRPYLNSWNVIGLTELGEPYKFKVRAYNDIDYVESDIAEIILAAVPDKPSTVV